MGKASKLQKVKIFGRTVIAVLLAEMLAVYSIDASTVMAYAEEISSQEVVAEVVDSSAGSSSDIADIASLYSQFMGSSGSQDAAGLQDAADSQGSSDAQGSAGSQTAAGSQAASGSQTSSGSQGTELSAAYSELVESTSALAADGTLRNVISGICSETNSEYYFSESYFDGTSKVYNPSLATMSMCLAMEARTYIASGDYSYGYKNAERIYGEMGFQDVEANYGETHIPTADSIGAVAAHKTITNDKGGQDTVVAVAIRGGNYEAEWAGNTKLGTTGEAQGFATARDQVAQFLLDYIKLHGGEFAEGGKVKIWITGFSRASATANLTGNFLDCAVQGTGQNTDLMVYAREVLGKCGVATEDIYCYGFEVPAGGHATSIYKAADNGNLWCLVDPDDPVPYVAPSTEGFKFFRYGNDVTLSKRSDGSNITRQLVATELLKFNTDKAKDFNSLHMTKDGFTAYRATITTFLANLGGMIDDMVDGNPTHLTALRAVDQSDARAKSMPDYLKQLVDFVAKTGKNRGYYASTIQPTVSSILEVFMYADGSLRSDLIGTLKDGFLDNLDYYNTSLALLESFDTGLAAGMIATTLTGKLAGISRLFMKAVQWKWSSTQEAKDNLTSAFQSALHRVQYESSLAGIFDTNDYATMINTAGGVVDFAYTLLYNDYKENDLQYVATGIYYGGELIGPHNTTTVTAYLRVNDPNYAETALGVHQLTLDLSEVDVNSLSIDLSMVQENIPDCKSVHVASFVNGEFKADYPYSNFVSASMSNGKLYLNIKTYYDCAKWTASVSTSSNETGSVSLSYYNCRHGLTTTGDPNQYFENTPISITKGDTLTLDMHDLDVEADLGKTVTTNFVYAQYSEATGGYQPFGGDASGIAISLNGKDASSTSVASDALRDNTFKAEGAADSKVVGSIYKIQTDENGQPVKDSKGNYQMTFVANANSFTTASSLDNESATYALNLRDNNEKVQLNIRFRQVALDGTTSPTVASFKYKLASESRWSHAGTGSDDHYRFKPGDTVVVQLARTDGEALVGWKASEVLNVTSGSEYEYELAFIMPDHDLDIEADILKTDDADTLAIVGGRWGAEYTSADTGKISYSDYEKPTDTGWSDVLFLQGDAGTAESYLQQGSHVFQKSGDSSGDPAMLFISAPKTRTDQNGVTYVFKRWNVTYADNGDACNDVIARTLDAEYAEDGTVQGAHYRYYGGDVYHVANGCTDNYMAIKGSLMTRSLRFTPVYECESYSIAKTNVDGSVDTSLSKKAGASVSLTTADSKGRHFASWSGTCKTSVQVDTGAGYTTEQYSESQMVFLDSTNPTLSFAMPAGDVSVTAHYTVDKFKVTTSRDVTTKNAVYDYAEGESVVLYLKTEEGKVVDHWELSDSSIQPIGITGEYGQIDRYVFTMPDHAVTVKPVMRDAKRYTLTFEGVAAKPVNSSTTVTGGVAPDLYEGQVVRVMPQQRAGYHVRDWYIGGSGWSVKYTVDEDDGSLYVTMPDHDIRVSPNYEQDWPFDSYSMDSSSLQSEESSLAADERTCTVKAIGDVLTAQSVRAGATDEQILEALPTSTFVEIEGKIVSASITWDIASVGDRSVDFVVKGTATPHLQGTEFEGATLKYAQGLSDAVRAFVAIEGAGALPAPELTSNAFEPGSYNHDLAVSLNEDLTQAALYYKVVPEGSAAPSAQDIVASGHRYEGKGIDLRGEAGKTVAQTVYAVFVAESSFSRQGKTIAEGVTSDVASFAFRIALPKDSKYSVTVANGTGAGQYVAGQDKATVTADAAQPGTTFTHLSVTGGSDLVLDDYSYGDTKAVFTMPAHDVAAVANYTIDTVAVTVDKPVAGQQLSSMLTIDGTTPSVVKGVGSAGETLSGATYAYFCTESGLASGAADYSTSYGVIGIVRCGDAQGYTFSDDCAVSVNGQKAEWFKTEGGIAFFYQFDATEATEKTDQPAIIGYAVEQAVILSLDQVMDAEDPAQYVFDKFPKQVLAFTDNCLTKVMQVDLEYPDDIVEKIQGVIDSCKERSSGFVITLEPEVVVPQGIAKITCKSSISISAATSTDEYFVVAPRADGDAVMNEGSAFVQLDLVKARRHDAATGEGKSETTYYFTVGSVASSADQEYDPVVSSGNAGVAFADDTKGAVAKGAVAKGAVAKGAVAKGAVAIPAAAITETTRGKEVDVSQLEMGQTYIYDQTDYVLNFAPSAELQYLRAVARTVYEDGHMVESVSSVNHYFVSKLVNATVVTMLDGKQVDSKSLPAYSWQGTDVAVDTPAVAEGKFAYFQGWTSDDVDVAFGDASAVSTQVSLGQQDAIICANFVTKDSPAPDPKPTPDPTPGPTPDDKKGSGSGSGSSQTTASTLAKTGDPLPFAFGGFGIFALVALGAFMAIRRASGKQSRRQ